MIDSIIHLMPEPLANQIAAGEVVQRPASAVKELLENALDAKATTITLAIEDAGKKSIRVTDDGSGMSPADARMAFERHATSKIRTLDDLFNIRTMGFRGEALASIAAVAQVQLRTRRPQDEMGTLIEMAGGSLVRQEPIAAPSGSSFFVNNLFFNVPARRNFLKSNPVETRHILAEFIHVALGNPGVRMIFEHNGTRVYDLPAGTLADRVLGLNDYLTADELLTVEEFTPAFTIRGYVAAPAAARKNRDGQFFFVNGRYVRSPYLHHAVVSAFADLIPADSHPFYVIFIDIEPKRVDINIHPTKTEVKFDDERMVYSLLHSIIRRSVGRLHAAPVMEGSPIALALEGKRLPMPEEQITLRQYREQPVRTGSGHAGTASLTGWETLFKSVTRAAPLHPAPQPDDELALFPDPPAGSAGGAFPAAGPCFQLPGGYIVCSWQGQLLLLHQVAAHQRVLYERLLDTTHAQARAVHAQQLAYPLTLTFGAGDALLLREVLPTLEQAGYHLQALADGGFLVSAIPGGIASGQVQAVLEQLLCDLQQQHTLVQEPGRERAAALLARRHAIGATAAMTQEEMNQLVQDLMKCQQPQFGPTGAVAYRLLSPELMGRLLQKGVAV